MNTEQGKSGNWPDTIALGYWPTIYANYHRHFRQSSLLIQAVAGTGPIDLEALDRALKATCLRHPLLNCRINEAGSAIVLQTAADTSAMLRIREVDKMNVVEIASSLLAEGIGDDMWRISLTRSPDAPDQWVLVMLCHHAIGDAYSMISLVDQMLTQYSKSSQQNYAPYDLQLLPGKLADDGIPHADAVTNLAEWQIEKFELLENRQVGFMEVPLEISDLKKYQQACRRENVSLTNLITAALLRAQGFTASARVATAVDIRRRVNPAIGPEHFGCFAGVIESVVPWADDIWEHARLSAANQYRGKSRLLMPVPSSAILTRIMQARIDSALKAKFFSGGCAVSNIGEIALQRQYGKLTVKRIIISSRQLAGHYGVFLTAIRFDGKLTLYMSFAHPLVTFSSVELLGRRLSDQLSSCLI